MDKITLLAPAKLNLTLDITGLLPNDYHALDSTMVSIDLCDTLTLSRTGSGVRLACDDPYLPAGRDNLIIKAATAFFLATGIQPGGLEMSLSKQIPTQAGLAGGSADAAAALVGLNHLYATGLSDSALAEIGLTVGSDIPFCLMGGMARVNGQGELLAPLSIPPGEAVFLIAKPARGVSTRDAFAQYDRLNQKPPPQTDAMLTALSAGRWEDVGPAMSNGFEAAVPVPEVSEIKAAIQSHDCLGVCMTGSGSAVAGLFPDVDTASGCLEHLGDRWPFVCLARPVDHGAKILADPV
ncbi:MAG: 4-(cytidine 5'-diphospho)-2-C-methyl-D-erythritol kinase [Oscillospiraceae bacterium]|nr:4-(cytidine 5'-diphospho)-2-C-methyl-D-erythritol kinase [Oscillospiraceae bacterium]